jgi:hypothetical protein
MLMAVTSVSAAAIGVLSLFFDLTAGRGWSVLILISGAGGFVSSIRLYGMIERHLPDE